MSDLDLSTDAKILLGTSFAMGRKTSLTFQMNANRPTARTQAALDELLAKEALTSEPANSHGGVTYRPLIDTMPYALWVMENTDLREIMRTFILVEPIT